MKKLPLPVVKSGKQKQLFFLNFNIDGKNLYDNDEVRVLQNDMKIETRKKERKTFIYIEECFKTLK